MNLNKKQKVKLLTIAVLALTAAHLWVSLLRQPIAELQSGISSDDKKIVTGVGEATLAEYENFNQTVDSLLVNDYAIRKLWIRNETIQFDRRVYLRKTVRIPPDFALTLFHLDLKTLADRNGWVITEAQENIHTGDLAISIGRNDSVYQMIQMMVSAGLQRTSKNISILVAGFGLTYDELTRAFIELPEPITLVVPPGQEYSAIVAHEARRAGKQVILRVPERKNIVRFETSMMYDSNAISRFYSLLQQAENGGAIVFYEKKSTLELLTTELPKCAKRGIRIQPLGKK